MVNAVSWNIAGQEDQSVSTSLNREPMVQIEHSAEAANLHVAPSMGRDQEQQFLLVTGQGDTREHAVSAGLSREHTVSASLSREQLLQLNGQGEHIVSASLSREQLAQVTGNYHTELL